MKKYFSSLGFFPFFFALFLFPSIIFAQITEPAQVTGLLASVSEYKQIDLSWVAPDDGGSPIIGYQIERESPIGSGFSVVMPNTGGPGTTYSDTELNQNTEYNYRVSAINTIGTGIASNEASAITENVLSYFAGGSGISEDPFLITTCQQLQNVNHFGGQSNHYYFKVMNDINCSDTVNWNSGAGFIPIGPWFGGSVDGNKKTVSNLFINNFNESGGTGLFGSIDSAIVSEIGLVNVDITGSSGDVGGLVGYSIQSHLENNYVQGNITGGSNVGGLVGKVSSLGPKTIVNSYTDTVVVGQENVGGLAGYLEEDNIYNSYAVGTTTSTISGNVGGLVGYCKGGYSNLIHNSGWYKGNKTISGIGYDSGTDNFAEVTYPETNKNVFYDKNHAIYTVGDLYKWSFDGNPWYEYTNSYPKFTEQEIIPVILRHTTTGSYPTGKNPFITSSSSIPPTDCLAGYLFSPSTGKACGTTSAPTTPKFTFTKNLKYLQIDNEVKELQKFLNTHGYQVSTTGAGSLDNETNYFGPKTKQTVIKFQFANNLTGDGLVGPITRGVLNSLVK
ncbi:MAG TPA: peptidoglycan-binding protein [Candidatus Paceibacterota bacterium]|nr:peptidoglycan-binding protein [Candidatus Paceibacterota bacterium]